MFTLINIWEVSSMRSPWCSKRFLIHPYLQCANILCVSMVQASSAYGKDLDEDNDAE